MPSLKTPRRKLVRWSVVGRLVATFKPPVPPMHWFFLSSTTYLSWLIQLCSHTSTGLENRNNGRGDPLRRPRDTLNPQKLALLLLLVGWDLRHQVLRPLLAYCTAPNDKWGWLWSNWWNEDWQGKPKYSEKTCPSATLSTTDPTWPDPCANTGRRGGKPATNRLSYGAA
jgi:hypothetical protein